jgi:hypothetical protein
MSDAQSDLAALREELAVANHEIVSRISAEVGAIEALQAAIARLSAELDDRKRKHLRSCQIAIGKSQLAKERYAENERLKGGQGEPVSVMPTTYEFKEAFVLSKYVDADQAEDLAEIATRACLDKVKELTQ